MTAKRKQSADLTPDALKNMDQETLVAVVLKLLDQNQQLSEQLQNFLQEKYGKKTERHDDPNQLRILSDGAATEISAEAETQTQPEGEKKESTKRKNPGHGRNPMPSHLPVHPIRREPTAEELVCHCGEHRSKTNEVVRNRRFECVPASFFVEEIIDSVWRCPKCNDSVVVEADVCEPITSGGAGPKLLATIAEDRWLKHLPYYRQEQIFARLGIDIARSTMVGWMASVATHYRRVYDAMKRDLLQSKVIATDDTPVKVQDRSKKANIRRGYEWIFLGDEEHPVNLFHYTHGRGRAGPLKFLENFQGFLQADCFSGNLALCAQSGATMVACNAHSRRYFKKAQANNKQLCAEILDMYSELFETERTARELALSKDDLVLMRQQESLPVLTKMKSWLDKHNLSALPASSFGKAVAYSLNNWESLIAYLQDADLRIDNNLAEQQMKMFATGRKNWYFFGSDEGGEHASIMLSVLSTCLRNGVEPGAYLFDTLTRLSQDPDCDIQDLLPHRWKPLPESAEIEGMNPTPQMTFS